MLFRSPEQQLVQLRERERLLAAAQSRPSKPQPNPAVPALAEPELQAATAVLAPEPAVVMAPGWVAAPPTTPTAATLPASVAPPTRMSQSLMERYQQAVEAQQRFIESLMGR